MYKVINYFQDLQDKEHEYNVGDIFPREGLEVSEERLAELSGNDNKRGIPLIAFDEEAAKAEEAKKAAEEAKKAEEEAKKKAEEEAKKKAEEEAAKKPTKK